MSLSDLPGATSCEMCLLEGTSVQDPQEAALSGARPNDTATGAQLTASQLLGVILLDRTLILHLALNHNLLLVLVVLLGLDRGGSLFGRSAALLGRSL